MIVAFHCGVEQLIYAATAAQTSHLFIFWKEIKKSPTPENVEHLVQLKLILFIK